MNCSRTACNQSLEGRGHYAIWNDYSAHPPRLYCIRCGRRIIYFNERDDKLKLRYEVRFSVIR